MTVDNIDVDATVQKAEDLLAREKGLPPALKMALDVLLLLVAAPLNLLNLNSRNSSKPPSTDPNRSRTRKANNRQPGGQEGHPGTTLDPTSLLQGQVRRTSAAHPPDVGLVALY